MKKFSKSIFIFHRDLRLADNISLLQASMQSQTVLPIFIFDDRQILKNEYKSQKAINFMLEALGNLRTQLQKVKGELFFFQGLTDKVLEKIIKKENIQAVFSNFDYTPFAQKRDQQILQICHKQKIDFLQFHDCLLINPNLIMSKKNEPYKKFFAFYKKAIELPVKKPQIKKINNFWHKKVAGADKQVFLKLFEKVSGENKNNFSVDIQKKLAQIKRLKNYNHDRHYPILEATTRLSSAIKFGVVSIRQIYWRVVKDLGYEHDLIRQLYWRDFFTYIAYYFPQVFRGSFNEKFKKLKWQKDKKLFTLWCVGQTGFPIVDAAMRQLRQTGFMPNRLRMVSASFLVKDLHLDWRWGEKYFAQKLQDYDPSVNNGNWQWVASTGVDAMPYFRVFNPWHQQKKYDPQAKYIKKWVLELKNIEEKLIHNLFKSKPLANYPAPIVNHRVASKISQNLYKSV